MNLFTIISVVIGIIISLSIIVVAIAFIFSKIRENDMTILRNANKDLRDTLEDNNGRIMILENEVKTLNVKVESLEKRNKTLEDLVITALKQYFFENPKVASQLKDIVSGQ